MPLARRTETWAEVAKPYAGPDEIRDLDPDQIDRSFITDRMEPEDARYRSLRESIRVKGQASPIMVRPHPTEPGRYQVAFGHRRLRAAAQLGRQVRCIIKPLSDLDLVIAQGQENSVRADLSFIERGRFAQALEERGYRRETIMRALNMDKSTTSRLISAVNRLPTDIVEAIGPAPGAGRDRWMALGRAFRRNAVDRPVDPLLESTDFIYAPSDQRFEMLYRHLKPLAYRSPKPMTRRCLSRTGQTIATATVTNKTVILTMDRAATSGFAEFLLGRLSALHADYIAGPNAPSAFRHSINR